MSKRFLYIIAVFMTLAMIALIVVQAYWINNAYELKEKQFSQLVNRAISNIINEVQIQEAVFHIINEIDSPDTNTFEQYEKFDVQIDASEYLETYQSEQEAGIKQKQTGPDDIYIFKHSQSSKGRSKITIVAEDTLLHDEQMPKIIIDTSGINTITWLSPNMVRTQIKSKITENRIFIDKIISNMMNPNIRLEERIKPEVLNKIIRNELDDFGIDLDYEFAVLKEDREIAYKTKMYDRNADVDYFESELFPRDVFKRPGYLSIYFPNKTTFIFSSLGFMTLSSIILTLIIIISFTITTYIIFKQKKLSDIKNDLINNMTHELKTPISTISLASQMINDKSIPEESKNLQHISRIIEHESKRLGYQVEKVLQMAIFDKGKIKLKLKPVNINELIRGVINNFQIQLNKQNGKIIEELVADNPEIIVDPVHFTNVISNLIDNAIKYSSENPEIFISTNIKKDKFIIKVKDNGIGIKKEYQKRIFEKFYRVPTGNIHNVKGFGLGLSYVKKIVDEHHGQIELKSELNKGTEFDISIPMNDYVKNHM